MLSKVTPWLALLVITVFAQTAVSDENTVIHANPSEFIAVTVSTDRTRAYINEQILITLSVRIHSEAFGITGTEPEIAGASITSLYKREYEEEVAGNVYKTVERVYAAFATKTGNLELAPISYRAQLPVSFAPAVAPEVANENQNSDALSSDVSPKSSPSMSHQAPKANPKISATSEALNLTITPPVASDTVWLPASKLTLSHRVELTNNKPDIEAKAGEPLTLLLEVKIAGQHPTAIPALQFASSKNLRLYPELPQWELNTTPTGIEGSLSQRLSVIGSYAGEFELPRVHIDWWDINQKKWRTTSTPAESLRILPAVPSSQSTANYWKQHWRAALVVTGFLSLLVGSMAVMLLRKSVSTTIQHLAVKSEPTAWRHLMRCVKRRDVLALKNATGLWSYYTWPDLSRRPTTENIKQHNVQLGEIMECLNKQLYEGAGAELTDWQNVGYKLKAIRREIKQIQVTASTASLPDLYPQLD